MSGSHQLNMYVWHFVFGMFSLFLVSVLMNMKELQISCNKVTDLGVAHLKGIYIKCSLFFVMIMFIILFFLLYVLAVEPAAF